MKKAKRSQLCASTLTWVVLVGMSTHLNPAWASSGADALLDAVQPQVGGSLPGGAVALQPSANALGEVKLNSPLAHQVFADWIAAGQLSFEANAWFRGFFQEQFESTAHLWGVLQKALDQGKVPATLNSSARAAYLLSLFRLNLPQTFFQEWMQALSQSTFVESKAALALEQTIAPDFENWFLAHAIELTGDHEALVQRLGPGRSSVLAALTASTLLRKGEAGAELLSKLPMNSAFRPLLAQTVAIALAKKNDLSGAARALKTHYEPSLLALPAWKDPKKLARYYLQIARLLYQAGSLEAAATYYEKVPSGMDDYLVAREELSWVWLRMGRVDRLRGQLETLTSQVLEDHFQPEAYLVRAVSNLKLCYYKEVENDFVAFRRANLSWAKRIEVNLSAEEPTAPRRLDGFSEWAVARLKAREQELKSLAVLSQKSISAVLPAVGPQVHWVQAQSALLQATERAKKIKAAEFRRQWKNDRQTLAEAIRKMQFVKVELLSQVSTLGEQAAPLVQDQVRTTSAAAVEAPGAVVFPFDGVIWPDELFRLRSVAQGRCLGQN